MDARQRLTAIESHGREFLAAAGRDLSAPVPPCRPWTMADMVWHWGEVHHFWGEIVRTAATDPMSIDFATRPDDEHLLAWCHESIRSFVDVVGSAPPDMTCWSWTGTVDAGWVSRRVLHETAVHLWDATASTGRPVTPPPATASDGIDEFLANYLPNRRETALPLGGSVHIHCTDTDGEWMIVPAEGMDLVVTREHAKGSCAIRGAAADLLLVLWRRVPLGAVEVIGNASVADTFLERANLE